MVIKSQITDEELKDQNLSKSKCITSEQQFPSEAQTAGRINSCVSPLITQHQAHIPRIGAMRMSLLVFIKKNCSHQKHVDKGVLYKVTRTDGEFVESLFCCGASVNFLCFHRKRNVEKLHEEEMSHKTLATFLK